MVVFVTEVHVWSAQEDVIVHPADYGSFKYYSKKDNNVEDCPHTISKKQYCESRNYLWYVPNKRPNKLREKLREFEDHLLHNKIMCFSWINSGSTLQILLSTGVVCTIDLDCKTGDLTQIQFEKQLASKLQVNILCDGAIISDLQTICVCNDGHVLGYGGPWREGWIVEGGPRRHLNWYGDWLSVWGKSEAEHPQPWSPLGKDYQRANLHLYWIGERGPELLGYKKTDGDPLLVVVSRMKSRALLVVEQKVTLRGSVSVDVSCLELVGGVFKRMSCTSVPLQTQVSCCALSPNENMLVIGCIDGVVALLNRQSGVTHTVKAHFISKFIEWHTADVCFLITNDRGQLQYFDIALNPIQTHLISDDFPPNDLLLDLSIYFNVQFTISTLHWYSPKNLILIALERGPILVLKHCLNAVVTFKFLALSYLQYDQFERAIRLLVNWPFNDEACIVLEQIVTKLLNRDLSQSNTQLIQDALASFYKPHIDFDPRQYQNRISMLARRFFHQLIRFQMFETAFLLAVDLGQHDLFMDLYYIALIRNEAEMASAARAQASAIVSRSSSELSSDSCCSKSSCSQCTSSTNSPTDDDNDDDEDEKNPHVKVPTIAKRATFVPCPQAPLTNYPRLLKAKKPQVKFSDTVTTAFILPEIAKDKSINTSSNQLNYYNPRKELADSLPLCHPNQDYLKDFMPVQKINTITNQEPEPSPKIKMVHFGLV